MTTNITDTRKYIAELGRAGDKASLELAAYELLDAVEIGIRYGVVLTRIESLVAYFDLVRRWTEVATGSTAVTRAVDGIVQLLKTELSALDDVIRADKSTA